MNSRIRFVFSAAAVLTAGALSVWTAVGWFVKPPSGETVSAGEIPVPTLLGQSAEEITFSPWTKYELDDRIPLLMPEWEAVSDGEQAEFWIGSALRELNAVCGSVFQIELDYDALTEKLEESSDFSRLYLYGLPVGSGSDAKMLYYAAEKTAGRGEFDFSIELRGNPDAEITEEMQESSLAAVKEDLRRLILDLAALTDMDPQLQLQQMISESDQDNRLVQFLAALFRADSQNVLSGRLMDFLTGLTPYVGWNPQSGEELSSLTLEEMIASMEFSSLQIVTLPSQILILIGGTGGEATGIYYDIALTAYSGVAIN